MSLVTWVILIVLIALLGGALWQSITLLRGRHTPRGIGSGAASVVFTLGIVGIASSSIAVLLPGIALLVVMLLWSATLLLGVVAVIVAGLRSRSIPPGATLRATPSWWTLGINIVLAVLVLVVAVLAGR